MSDPQTAAEAEVPKFGARRLLVIGTGAIGVAFLPFWINWLRVAYPELETRVVVTRSAERFVTRGALTPLLGRPVDQDQWPEEPEIGAAHVDLAQWPDAVVVYPASLHFIARLALGLADTPALLALQCTSAPIAVAPALPPGALGSFAYQQHLIGLGRRPNIVVAPPQSGFSVSTRKADASTAAPLSQVIPALERLRVSLAPTKSPAARETRPE